MEEPNATIDEMCLARPWVDSVSNSNSSLAKSARSPPTFDEVSRNQTDT